MTRAFARAFLSALLIFGVNPAARSSYVPPIFTSPSPVSLGYNRHWLNGVQTRFPSQYYALIVPMAMRATRLPAVHHWEKGSPLTTPCACPARTTTTGCEP